MESNQRMSWYFDKKELRKTPSLVDNIDYETEMRYRREGARFIIDTGSKMDLGYNTTATGVVYFHRFYMYHSFKSFPRYVTACCCLFLAGKVEETPKKCKDIIRMAKSLLTAEKFLTFGDDAKEEVMTLERILLQTIKFDLQIEHPYSFLLKYAKCLKGDKVKLPKMVQMAWTFVNDSLCTTLCLQWEPEIIAVALMYLACKLNKFEVVDWVGRTTKHLRWWDMFLQDVTMELLEDICHQVLDLYATPQGRGNPPPSPPPARLDGLNVSPNPDFIKEGGKKVKVEVVSVGKAVPMGGGEVIIPSKIVVGTPPTGILVGRPQTIVDSVIYSQPPPPEPPGFMAYPPPPSNHPMAYPPAYTYPHPPLP